MWRWCPIPKHYEQNTFFFEEFLVLMNSHIVPIINPLSIYWSDLPHFLRNERASFWYLVSCWCRAKTFRWFVDAHRHLGMEAFGTSQSQPRRTPWCLLSWDRVLDVFLIVFHFTFWDGKGWKTDRCQSKLRVRRAILYIIQCNSM